MPLHLTASLDLSDKDIVDFAKGGSGTHEVLPEAEKTLLTDGYLKMGSTKVQERKASIYTFERMDYSFSTGGMPRGGTAVHTVIEHKVNIVGLATIYLHTRIAEDSRSQIFEAFKNFAPGVDDPDTLSRELETKFEGTPSDYELSLIHI